MVDLKKFKVLTKNLMYNAIIYEIFYVKNTQISKKLEVRKFKAKPKVEF